MLHFIMPSTSDGRSPASSSASCPATGQVLARVAEGDKEDIDRAVRAARRTFDDGRWARMNPGERQRLLLRIADLIEQHGDELAQLETLDNGKPFAESRNVDIPST